MLRALAIGTLIGLVIVGCVWGMYELAVYSAKKSCESANEHSPYVYVWDRPNCIYVGVK